MTVAESRDKDSNEPSSMCPQSKEIPVTKFIIMTTIVTANCTIVQVRVYQFCFPSISGGICSTLVLQ